VGIGSLIRKGRTSAKPTSATKKKREPQWVATLVAESLVSTREVQVSPGMWLSPSVLSSWCPRAWVMAYRMGVPLLDELGPDNRWWMDGGTALHRMFQEQWLAPTGVIKGGWRCPACARVMGIDLEDDVLVRSHGNDIVAKVTVGAAISHPGSCLFCGYKPNWHASFSYVEPLLYDSELLVCGWTDGLLDWGDDDQELWDLKTKVSSDSMGWIREAPDGHHVCQLNWYMGMAGVEYGRIVYFDSSAKHLAGAFVEHLVEYDPQLMAKEKEKVIAFREAAENPESSLPACPNGGETRFGPCTCRELSRSWKDYRARP